MIFYAYLLFTGGQGDFSQTNPYHQNFNPLSMMRNAVHYLALYFDPFNPDMSYTMFKMTAIPGLLLFVCCVGAAFWLALKKRRWYALISLVAAAGSLVVVLPMENMQHRLYLYIPSIFMALFFAFLIIELQRCSKKQIAGACAVLCCTLCYSLNSAPGVVTLRNYWLSVCGSDAAQMAQLKKLDAPARYAEIYVKGAQNDYNVFYYGPGNVLRLLYDDATLHTTLVDEFPEDVQTPYLFLEYNDGEITEVERDDTPRPQVYIEDVYPNMIDLSSQTGDLVLAVTGSIDWSDLEIRVNDEAVPFVAGEEFCSFTIPRQYLKKGETLRITLYSELACGESEAVEVPIQ